MPTTSKNRPAILQRLQKRIQQYFRAPASLPSLNAANRSRRQQRSERREACILALTAILEYTDLASLRCGIPGPGGFDSLTLDYLAAYTGMGQRRMERAVADLKRANLLTINQPRQLLEDGSYRGLPAVKAVNSLLFGVFGLLEWLKHERARATKRLEKKAKKAGGTISQWAKNALVIGRILVVGKGGQPSQKPQKKAGERPQLDPITYERFMNDLMRGLKEEDSTRDAPTCRRMAEEILNKRLAG